MVDIEILKRIIVENQQFIAAIALNKRDYAFEPKGRYVLVGLRQAGKSYLLYQRADSHNILKWLKNNGASLKSGFAKNQV